MIYHVATDVKKVWRLVLCLRCVADNLGAHDKFISLKNMPTIDADSIR